MLRLEWGCPSKSILHCASLLPTVSKPVSTPTNATNLPFDAMSVWLGTKPAKLNRPFRRNINSLLPNGFNHLTHSDTVIMGFREANGNSPANHCVLVESTISIALVKLQQYVAAAIQAAQQNSNHASVAGISAIGRPSIHSGSQ
ncbi:MAG: hypothetical protein Q8M16_16580 [Pirellulaceae bacterium]|nr:hypothetical protein [Pirellulaceae bacterium]